ncbi:MAG TPA: hypothetical protein VFO76_00440 [Candidatus Kapabacteria bacterium]|nr:hypothetical protein [Candidatus Kapabacteria bacterium]
MTQNNTFRTALMSFVIIALSVTLATAATGSAQGKHIKLSGNGKTYEATADENGNFSFTGVEPGTYKLVWVLPKGTTPQNTESASIEISSFSWGASNSTPTGSMAQGKSTPATRSNISNNRGGASVDGELSQGKSTPATRSNISNNRTGSQLQVSNGECFTVVLEDVVISSVTTASGTVKTCTVKPTAQTSVR